MNEEWFYALGQKPVGPLTTDALVAFLRTIPAPGDIKIWHPDFQHWQFAKDVSEIASRLVQPSANPSDTSTSTTDARDQGKQPRRLVAFLVVLLIVIAIGATFSTVIYQNSVGGIKYLAAELFGAALILSLLSFPARRLTYTPAVVLFVAALCVGLHNMQKFSEGLDLRKSKTILASINDPSPLDKALQLNPSNSLLMLLAEENKLALETERLADKLSNDIEPAAFGINIDFLTASRASLQVFLSNLKIAEENATAVMPQYVALQKSERDKLERYAHSLNLSRSATRDMLSGVDKRHAKSLALTSKMIEARKDVYRAYETLLTILISEFGNYKADANRQIVFQNPDAVASYDAVVDALNSAKTRVANLDAERKQLLQSHQEEGWQRFVSGQTGSN